MKKHFTLSKRLSRWLTLGFSMIILSMIISACKRELLNVKNDLVNGSLSVNEAKQFFNSEVLPKSPLSLAAINSKNLDLSKTNVLLFKDLVWDQAKSQEVQDGMALKIPIRFKYKTNLNTKISFDKYNYFIIKKDNSGKLDAYWVMNIPNKEWLKDQTKSYMGNIIEQDWDGNFKRSFTYDGKGKINEYQRPIKKHLSKNSNLSSAATSWVNISTNNVRKLISEQSGGGTSLSDTTGLVGINPADTLSLYMGDGPSLFKTYKDVNGDCWMNIAQISYWDIYGGGVTLIRTAADCGPLPNGESRGGGGGIGDYAKDCAGVPGGTAYIDPNCKTCIGGITGLTGCPLELKTDSLKKKFPCADKLVVQPILTSPIMSKLVEPFLTPQRPTVTYLIDNTLPWGNTTTGGAFKLGENGPDLGSVIGQSSIVRFNEKMLQNSSQLLIAATVVHETLHGYINYKLATANHNYSNYYNSNWMVGLDNFYLIGNLPVNYSNHTMMLEDYFDKSMAVLQAWNAKQGFIYSEKDMAMAMLYGLDAYDMGTSQAQKNNINAAFQAVKTKYKISTSDLTKFNTTNLFASTHKLPTTGCN